MCRRWAFGWVFHIPSRAAPLPPAAACVRTRLRLPAPAGGALSPQTPSAPSSQPLPPCWCPSTPFRPLLSPPPAQQPQPRLPAQGPAFPTRLISPQLGLDAPRGSAPRQQRPPPRQLRALLEDLLEAQEALRDVDVLSALALLLPQGACAGRAPGPPASGPGGTANGTWAGAGANSTAEEGAPSAAAPGSSDATQGQCSAFVQLWAGLQPILCGNNR